MLFDVLAQAFRVLGGVPQRGIFDNMRAAVDRIGSGKARQVNARFAAMASHYLFETDFCNPASGWEKGQVEKNVQDARRRYGSLCPASLTWLRSTLGLRHDASSNGGKSSTALCPAPSLMYMPPSAPA
jgi:transposase